MGIGSVWLGIYPREERMSKISDFLNLPRHIIPFSAIAAGYSEETPEHPDRFIESRIHYGEFGKEQD